MCNKAVENYPHALEYASKCYKTQKMCDKSVDAYPSTIKFVTECYRAKEMYHRAVHRRFCVFDSIADKYKTQEICNLAVSLYFPFIVYCPCKYITQEMWDEAVNDSLAALKLIPDWFIISIISEMIKKLFTAQNTDNNKLYLNDDSDDAVFHYNERDIVNIDLNNISLDDNLDEEDPNTIVRIRLFA